MQNIKALLLLPILVIVISSTGLAQQQAMSTMYMFNGLMINPAYAGSHETLSLTAHFRNQWTGLDGAPNTQSFSAHGPLRKDKIALGLLFFHDKIGVTSNTNITPTYAYRIHFKNNAILSFGLQTSFNYYSAKYSELNPIDKTDLSFTSNVNKWLFNVGTGVYYYTPRYYLGFSIPQMLINDVSTDANISTATRRAEFNTHYYFTGGYLFYLNDNLVLKPSTLFKVVKGAPASVDLNANLYFSEFMGVGVSYRWKESVSLLADIVITDGLRFAYAYDLSVADIRTVNNGSHEVMVNFRFPYNKEKIVNTRYF